MSAIPVPNLNVSIPWQIQFLAVLPAIQTHAGIRFRSLPAEARADATQEAIASACVAFQRLAVLGQLDRARPGTLADFAVKHVNSGRHVGGSQDGAKDVHSPLSQRRNRLKLVSYSVEPNTGGSWDQMAVEDKRMGVADVAAFRLDFAEWIGEMNERDRKIIAALAAGDGTAEVAGRLGLTAGRISQLRREYEQRWQVFQGEVPAAEAC